MVEIEDSNQQVDKEQEKIDAATAISNRFNDLIEECKSPEAAILQVNDF